jgi:peroxiredoxin/Flp pilus assembly protein TadD
MQCLGGLILVVNGVYAEDVVTDAAANPKAAEQAGTDSILAGHSYHGDAFNEGPRQAAYLMPGMAPIDFPTSASQPRAQAFFEQGIAQLHGFWYFEAERSFRQAAAIDSDFAMAYWGMSLANRENADRARGFIETAVKLKDKATPREQKYIEAYAQFFKPLDEAPEPKTAADDANETERKLADLEREVHQSRESDKEQERRRKLLSDLERIIDQHPEDIEAKALLIAEMWFAQDTGLGIVSRYAVNALLGDIFEANPAHPAHHYRIHLWDYVRAENALQSAALCGAASPGIAHMWHMPGHTYSNLHRYSDAAWQQEASARIDHAYMIRDRVMPDQIHNFAHNNEWLIRNLIHLGRVPEALGLAHNMISLPRHPKYNTLGSRGSGSLGRERLWQVLFKYEQWQQLIDEITQGALTVSNEPDDEARRAAGLAIAYYRLGHSGRGDELSQVLRRRLWEANQELKQLDQMTEAQLSEVPSPSDAKDPQPTDRKARRQELRSQTSELNGWVALCDAAAAANAGDSQAVQRLLDKSGKVDSVERSQWLDTAGDAAAALKAAEKAAEDNPGEVRPLAQLALLQWQAGDQEKAKQTFQSLRSVASEADLTQPIFQRLNPLAEASGASADWREPPHRAEDFGQRPDLDQLGPFRWRPYAAPSFTVSDRDGTPTSFERYQGKPTILIFYLGFGCLHCIEQLQAFEPEVSSFKELGIDLVAVSTEDPKQLQLGMTNYDKPISIPLLADPELSAFKAWRCFDDFEQKPLHGTFLIDAAGRVRWQDISFEPFTDVAFLKDEAKRLLSQPD